jgi:hypothetical protein
VISADRDLIGQLQPRTSACFVETDTGALSGRAERKAFLNRIRERFA